MTKKLQDKVAVITGGTTGIGFAAAKRFVDEGAKVILTGTNPKTLEAARSELGGKAEVIASDASNEQDVKALFKEVHFVKNPKKNNPNSPPPRIEPIIVETSCIVFVFA